MKIKSIELFNFRRFEEQEFRFDSDFTVLIGDNASGKTQILDALSVLLGTYLLRCEERAGRTGILKEEVRVKIYQKKDGVMTVEPQNPSILKAEGTVHETPISWKRYYDDRGGHAKQVIHTAEQHLKAIQEGKDVNLPVLPYYGSERLWAKHSKVKVKSPDSRTVGYRNCLDAQSDHHLFEEWFKTLELSSLQTKKPIGLLESVRSAVTACIPNAKSFYFNIAYDEPIIVFENEEQCLFANLCDGYKNRVGLVADIAHRAARLNPHLGKQAASRSCGVVLIDEIDLHLHPKGQRKVVNGLRTTFPKIQFIVTAHSPFIIQQMEPGEVIDLNHLQEPSVSSAWIEASESFAMPAPQNEYSGKSIEDITEVLTGLNRNPANQNTVSDRRWNNRREAWDIATESKND